MDKKLCFLEVLIISFVGSLVVGPNGAFGSGFAIFTHGAAATGLSGSVIAHSNSPSSIFYNPALINGLEGTRIELGTTLLLPTRKFTSDASGSEFKTRSEVFYPSTFFITNKLNEKVSLGMGVFNNFGLATRWNDNWEGKYLATNSELTVFTFNPVVSIRLTELVSFAAGVDYMILDATLEKQLNLNMFPDANQKFKGDGNGVGYNLGIFYEITDHISVGASYRSRIKAGIKGDLIHRLPAESEPFVGHLFPNTHAESKLTFPSQLQFGVAIKGTRKFTVETGLRKEGWSSYKEQQIVLSQPVAGLTSAVTEKNWNDTYSFNAGSDYRVSDGVSLLAGYLYSGNPIPDGTFEPAIPDSNTHVFTIGTEFRYKAISVGLSYGYQLLEGRKKNNSLDDNPLDGVVNPLTSANGKYKTNLHAVGISLSYRF